MQTSITLSLDTRSVRKDGTHPIILRLTHFRNTTAIGTGYHVEGSFWDDNKKRIKSGYKGYSSVNKTNDTLWKMLLEKRDVINKLDDKSELAGLSLKEVRSRLEKSQVTQSLSEYTKDLIENLKKVGKFGTARAYTSMHQAVCGYLGTEEVSFNRITLNFLKEFETAYISRGNSYNGLSAILRSLRAVINKAINDGVIEPEQSPFPKYKVKNMPTAKRAIDASAMQKIIDLELAENHPCFEARNIFILSYYFWGMNLIDLCYLQVKNIVDGRIKYGRKKTHKQFDIKILPEIQPILDFYAAGKEKENYLLPVIKRESEIEKDKDILWYRKRYNKKLRMIAVMCGIQEHLTSYVSRHSFASQAEQLEIPIQAISRMLGHTKLSTTEIYLKGFKSSAIDAYHDKVFKR